jgi:anti-sigma-K factor RskA
MADRHIITHIENTPLAALSEADLNTIRVHTAECSDCRRAFQAAQVSSVLLKESAGEPAAPPPFFNTRVMATLRERQANASWSDAWAFGRMWRAVGALASSMVATVAVLAVLTFALPGSQIGSESQAVSSLPNNYSAEELILYQNEMADEQSSDGQVLTSLYSGDDEAPK